MASLILHPSGVPLLLLLVALTPISGCTPSSSENLAVLNLVKIGQGTFFMNATLYPVMITCSFTPLHSTFLDKMTKFLTKFSSFEETIFKNQIKIATYSIRNLQNSFSTLYTPPKVARHVSEEMETLTRHFFSEQFQKAATAPITEILDTTVPAEAVKAGTVMNSFMTELNLLTDLIDQEIKGYRRVIEGKLTKADLRLMRTNDTFDQHSAISIQYLKTFYEENFKALYNIYVFDNPVQIEHFRPKNMGNFRLKVKSFYVYENQAVTFKPNIEKNVLTMQVLYNTAELQDLRTSTNLNRYLIRKTPSLFDQNTMGDIILNPNNFDTSVNFNTEELYNQFKEKAGNFSLKIGKTFAGFIIKKSGIKLLENNNFTDKDILNYIDEIFQYLPPYWQWYLAISLTIIVFTTLIIYTCCKRRKRNRLNILEEKDIKNINLLNRGELDQMI